MGRAHPLSGCPQYLSLTGPAQPVPPSFWMMRSVVCGCPASISQLWRGPQAPGETVRRQGGAPGTRQPGRSHSHGASTHLCTRPHAQRGHLYRTRLRLLFSTLPQPVRGPSPEPGDRPSVTSCSALLGELQPWRAALWLARRALGTDPTGDLLFCVSL